MRQYFLFDTPANIKVRDIEKIPHRKRSIDTSNNRRCKSSERNTSNRYRAKFVSVCCCSLISRFLPRCVCLSSRSFFLDCVSHLVLCCNEQMGARGGIVLRVLMYIYIVTYTRQRFALYALQYV